jgi:hypothetical protein
MIYTDEGTTIVKAEDDSFILIHNTIDITEEGVKLPSQTFSTIQGETEKETLQLLLYRIAEEFGFGYDKFSKENINITFDKKGHKVCDDEEKIDENMQSVSEFVDEQIVNID